MSLLQDYSPSSASEITIILDDDAAKDKVIESTKLKLTKDITRLNSSTGGLPSSKNHQRNSWVIVSN